MARVEEDCLPLISILTRTPTPLVPYPEDESPSASDGAPEFVTVLVPICVR